MAILDKQSDAWNLIPEAILLEEKIWALVPVKHRIYILLVQLQNPNQSRRDIRLDELCGYLTGVAQYSDVWSKIPTDILLEKQIWPIAPASRRNSIILAQLDEQSSYESAVEKIAELLNSTSNDHTSLIAKIPAKAKQHDKIFPFLPASEQVQALGGLLSAGSSRNISILSRIETIISNVSLGRRHSLISQLPDWAKELPAIRCSLYKVLTAAFRLDAPDAQQIRSFVAERGINCLCHFTTIENLQGICCEGAILSNRQLQTRNSQYNQIDSGRWDGKQNHICCSINSYNSMYFYHAEQRSQCWLLLGIQPDYLWKQETLFCQINAASRRGAYIKEGFAKLQSMFAPVVTDINGREYTRGLQTNLPTCIQAEVLVHESISLEDVICIWIKNDDSNNVQKVRNAGWKGKILRW